MSLMLKFKLSIHGNMVREAWYEGVRERRDGGRESFLSVKNLITIIA